MGALKPLMASDAQWDLVGAISITIGIGFVLPILAWQRISWSRWIIIIWLFAPGVSALYTGSLMTDAEFIDLVLRRFVLSWYSWLDIVVAVFFSYRRRIGGSLAASCDSPDLTRQTVSVLVAP